MKELEFYKPYSYFGADVVYAQMYVSFAAKPQIKEGESLTAYITVSYTHLYTGFVFKLNGETIGYALIDVSERWLRHFFYPQLLH